MLNEGLINILNNPEVEESMNEAKAYEDLLYSLALSGIEEQIRNCKDDGYMQILIEEFWWLHEKFEPEIINLVYKKYPFYYENLDKVYEAFGEPPNSYCRYVKT